MTISPFIYPVYCKLIFQYFPVVLIKNYAAMNILHFGDIGIHTCGTEGPALFNTVHLFVTLILGNTE